MQSVLGANCRTPNVVYCNQSIDIMMKVTPNEAEVSSLNLFFLSHWDKKLLIKRKMMKITIIFLLTKLDKEENSYSAKFTPKQATLSKHNIKKDPQTCELPYQILTQNLTFFKKQSNAKRKCL